jgi:hypothetical protein
MTEKPPTKHPTDADLKTMDDNPQASHVSSLVDEIRYLHELISEWRWTCSYYTIANDRKHPAWRRHYDALTKVRDTLKADNHYPSLVVGLTHVLEGDEWDGARWRSTERTTAEEGRDVAMSFIRSEATPENLRRLLEGVHSMRSWVSFWGDRDREMPRQILVRQLIAECDNLLSGRDALDDGRGRNR